MHRTTSICLVFCLLFIESVIFTTAGEATTDDTISNQVKDDTEAVKETGGIETDKAEIETSSDVLSKQEAEIGQLNLPEDTSPRFTVSVLQISGNTLLSDEELLNNLPQIYNASDKALQQAESGELYDLRALHDILLYPGQPKEVSRRTLQGFTQYILSVYQNRGYAGIYVYIAAQSVQHFGRHKTPYRTTI